VKVPEHKAIPEAGGDVFEDDHAFAGDAARFFEAGLGILGVMQDEDEQDDVEAVIFEREMFAIEESEGQISFVEVFDIDGDDLAADSFFEELVEAAIAGADVEDAAFAIDEGAKVSSRPAGAMGVDSFSYVGDKAIEHASSVKCGVCPAWEGISIGR
jgi:hypothetical protein